MNSTFKPGRMLAMLTNPLLEAEDFDKLDPDVQRGFAVNEGKIVRAFDAQVYKKAAEKWHGHQRLARGQCLDEATQEILNEYPR